ncbi:MAG: DUF2249 domain-containing protein [Magnetovibrio sp.]|nr:DUF2249 domain-containing protein [Magnetovibrio sp.]
MTKRWQEDDGLHLDLHGLSPPEPMIKVLQEIEGGEYNHIVLHMDRDPIHLYEELAERGWRGQLVSHQVDEISGDVAVIVELSLDTKE